MNTLSLANRLIRDFNVKSITEITADGRMELVDAINSAIQRFYDLSPELFGMMGASVGEMPGFAAV